MSEIAVRDMLSEVLLQSCGIAATSFSDAIDWLRHRLPAAPEHEIPRFLDDCLARSDFGAIACTIYLLAQVHSPDLAAETGWQVLERGCDDDQVIIALADVLHVQSRPRQSAAFMMRDRLSSDRSTAFLTKLADHYWAGGQAFLAEDLLRDMISQGRQDVMLRLAEHWFEQRDWRSARELLQQLPAHQVTAYTIYLAGRCAVSFLIEDEVLRAIEHLAALPEQGPSYALLLRSVWIWRVGHPDRAVALCPAGNFPPLPARDASALRTADSLPAPRSPEPCTGIWRDISRHDLPNVLCIGMQRTGTTWLWTHLSKHIDVSARTFKEPAFFNDPFGSAENFRAELRSADLGESATRYWQGPTRSLYHYRVLFSDRKRLRVDMSPSYGELSEDAVSRVRSVLSADTAIFLSVRDPVERTWSNFKYDLLATGEHPLSFSFEQRTKFYRTVATWRRSDYASVLRTWQIFFVRVKIVWFDDILTRPDALLSEIGEFIDCPPTIDDSVAARVNNSGDADLPREDRLFLFGLYQSLYDSAEAVLGASARAWRRRQLMLLGQ